MNPCLYHCVQVGIFINILNYLVEVVTYCYLLSPSTVTSVLKASLSGRITGMTLWAGLLSRVSVPERICLPMQWYMCRTTTMVIPL